MNEYKKILSCWHKLEHFSPASAPKISDKGVEILKNQEHWKIPSKSNDPNKTIEYTIFLGVFDSKVVNDFVSKYFNNSEIDENFRNSKICFASLKLDEIGQYVNNSFGLSTLPWAIAQLDNNKIKTNNWEKEFDKVKENLKEFIDLNFKETITNSNNDEVVEVSKIVSNSQLLNLQDKIEKLCNWSVNPLKEIYIKRDEKYKSNKDKDSNNSTDILNSFYIKDLETIISKYNEKSTPKAFQQYLDGCLNKQSERIDIVKDINKLKEILTPNNYPDGCWPSKFTLSLMQQFAVNSIFNGLSDSQQAGMYSVNGPPGTGKTTLLRDIIAPIFVKRAKELIKIDNPADAFNLVGGYIKDKKTPFIYAPEKSITNGGIVIASSNNGAVENISKELPLKKEVSEQYRKDISYFKPVAENCVDKNNWGIFSAVLGNKSNINELISSVWWNKDVKDLKKTLEENKIKENKEWDEVRDLFSKKLKEISNEKVRLNSFIEDYENAIKIENTISELKLKLEEWKGKYDSAKIEYESYGISVNELNDHKNEILNELSIIQTTKPNFFIYWINKNKRKLYNNRLESVLHKYNENTDLLKKLETLEVKTNDLSKKCKKILEDIEIQQKISTDLNNKILEAKAELKNNYADIDYWNNIESKKSQESCPWYSDKLKELQSELFIKALKVNETFILTANATTSRRISKTLSGFFEYLKGGGSASKQEIKAMWDTFFLVIPVISSSFASIQTLFKDLDKEDIPWLFIDEAGQAIPQAAVGSIWRSKRVGIVGDPFQIEPVVTIPKSITDNISNYFDLNSTNVSSELSVQSMADRINPLGSYLEFNNKKEWIGMPLRVHRRCVSPMFEIANEIAYDNTMYNSTPNPKSVNVNFESSFIDCKGKVKGKHFVEEQAKIIRDILISEINFNKGLPDIFVISPFSEISNELKKYLLIDLKNEVRKFKEVATDEINNWIKSNVGTVHTFQGKQAEGVILCLGLDDNTKGASNWASEKPNLLNVAITRAKYRFIAVGDKDIWLKQNYFNQLQNLNG